MRLFILKTAAVAMMLAGCNGPRINEQLADAPTLKQNQQAIGLFRVARPDPSCLQLGVQLGVRDNGLYRPGNNMKLTQTAVTQVVEMILPPGEYHIVSLTCFRARSTLVMSDPQGDGRLRQSYASFTLSAGEIVNLGEIRLLDKKRTHGIWTSFHDIGVEIGDWPLHELERFKSQRPKLYAEMRTRLMTALNNPSMPEQIPKLCDDARRLQAEGKLQNLPVACAAIAQKKT